MIQEGPLKRPIEVDLPALRPVFEQHDVVLAYLYGSQAKSAAGPLSDVDIAVLFRPGLGRKARAVKRLALNSKLMQVFQRQDVFVADLADATPLLKNEVRHGGQVLYCADEALRVDFEVRALQEFVDTEPLRHIRKQYLLERIDQGAMGRYVPQQGR